MAEKNTFFQFKQFRVEQSKASMKVCTDACLLGAYISPEKTVKSILDIGTGTGLLALMLAQKNPHVKIDAVELDTPSYEQAEENVFNSPWKDSIHVYHQSIQNFSVATSKRYDLIVSNPPFFKDYLKSDNGKKNTALHQDTLSLPELAEAVAALLDKDGSFYLLLPPYESSVFEKLAKDSGLNLNEKLSIRDSENSQIIREISVYGYQELAVQNLILIIKDSSGKYTPEFARLLRDYYLIF